MRSTEDEEDKNDHLVEDLDCKQLSRYRSSNDALNRLSPCTSLVRRPLGPLLDVGPGYGACPRAGVVSHGMNERVKRAFCVLRRMHARCTTNIHKKILLRRQKWSVHNNGNSRNFSCVTSFEKQKKIPQHAAASKFTFAAGHVFLFACKTRMRTSEPRNDHRTVKHTRRLQLTLCLA